MPHKHPCHFSLFQTVTRGHSPSFHSLMTVWHSASAVQKSRVSGQDRSCSRSTSRWSEKRRPPHENRFQLRSSGCRVKRWLCIRLMLQKWSTDHQLQNVGLTFELADISPEQNKNMVIYNNKSHSKWISLWWIHAVGQYWQYSQYAPKCLAQ